jgi:hypothetical protein
MRKRIQIPLIQRNVRSQLIGDILFPSPIYERKGFDDVAAKSRPRSVAGHFASWEHAPLVH